MQFGGFFSKAGEGGAARAAKRILRSRAVSLYILPALAAFFLSRAVTAADMAPLGAAIFAAYGRGKRALSAFIAAAVGYFTLSGEVMIYKYIIALLIIFAVNTALGRRELHAAVRPLCSGAALFMPSFILWALFDMSEAGLVMTVCECALLSLSVRLFSDGLSAVKNFRLMRKCDRREQWGLLYLVSALCFSLTMPDCSAASAGHMAAFAAAFILAEASAAGGGALLSVIFGLFISLADKNLLGLCAVYPVSAALCGVLSGVDRRAGVIGAFFGAAAMNFYFLSPHTGALMTLCALAGAAAALLCPIEAIDRINAAFVKKSRDARYDRRMRELICDRLLGMSAGYRDVCDAVCAAQDRLFKTNLSSVATVFEMTARRACRSCAMMEVCWQERYADTIDALNQVTEALSRKKMIYEEDLPARFRAACLHTDIFTEALNDSYRDWLMRRKLSQKQRRTKKLTMQQYSSLSAAMNSVAREFKRGISFNIDAEEKIIEYLKSISLHPKSVLVMEREGGRISAELDFFENETLCLDRDALRREVSFICGVSLSRMSVSRRDGVMRITLGVPEPLSPVYACFGITKDGETQSGDTADAFKTGKGKLVLTLCDGMGSGRAAADDSRIAAGVIRRIISSCFDNDTAVAVLNSAMMLKSDSESVTGVDIAVMDLYSGKCEFLKLGAAPTYVLRGGRVIRIDASSLPVGVLEEPRLVKSQLGLSKGDVIVMVSDGVVSAGDAFLCDLLERFGHFEAHRLAGQIVRCAVNASPEAAMDDMSALVCVI